MLIEEIFFTGNNVSDSEKTVLEVCLLLNGDHYEKYTKCEMVIDQNNVFTALQNFQWKKYEIPNNSVLGNWSTESFLSEIEKKQLFDEMFAQEEIQEVIKSQIWNKEIEVIYDGISGGKKHKHNDSFIFSYAYCKTELSDCRFELEFFQDKNTRKFYAETINHDGSCSKFHRNPASGMATPKLNKKEILLERYKAQIKMSDMLKKIEPSLKLELIFLPTV